MIKSFIGKTAPLRRYMSDVACQLSVGLVGFGWLGRNVALEIARCGASVKVFHHSFLAEGSSGARYDVTIAFTTVDDYCV